MKSLKKVFLVILILIILAGIIVLILMNTKTAWHNDLEMYGPLNIMVLDDGVLSNESDCWFDIEPGKDFKVAGEILVTKGSVTITYTLEDEVLSEEVYSNGNYSLESDVYLEKNGQLYILCSSSDDVEGTYSLSVFTRQSFLKKIIDSFREKWN